jgi:signal transduction histidine kinase
LPEELTIRADGDRLSQVLLNLVKNACEATPRTGTVTVGAARAETVPFLRAQLPPGERLATLFVRDNGSGIPPEVVERIFEPLFTTRRAGHGIGLALASQIVAQHSGQILIDTAPERGSTFYLVLPLA